jgi:hypothetical protein
LGDVVFAGVGVVVGVVVVVVVVDIGSVVVFMLNLQ